MPSAIYTKMGETKDVHAVTELFVVLQKKHTQQQNSVYEALVNSGEQK